MDLREHAFYLGAVVGNFLSLELALRCYLGRLPGAIPFDEWGKDPYSVPIGEEMAENAFTNYDSLGTLFDKYNASVHAQGFPRIDRTLVEIRDALAHGRVSSQSENGTLRLMKFSRPHNGRVTVTFNGVMSEEWFIEQKRRSLEALMTVASNPNVRITEPESGMP